jgi:hypothetical protein
MPGRWAIFPRKFLVPSTGIAMADSYGIGCVSREFSFCHRETREGWPLLTVETELNWDTGSTYERSASLVGL